MASELVVTVLPFEEAAAADPAPPETPRTPSVLPHVAHHEVDLRADVARETTRGDAAPPLLEPNLPVHPLNQAPYNTITSTIGEGLDALTESAYMMIVLLGAWKDATPPPPRALDSASAADRALVEEQAKWFATWKAARAKRDAQEAEFEVLMERFHAEWRLTAAEIPSAAGHEDNSTDAAESGASSGVQEEPARGTLVDLSVPRPMKMAINTNRLSDLIVPAPNIVVETNSAVDLSAAFGITQPEPRAPVDRLEVIEIDPKPEIRPKAKKQLAISELLAVFAAPPTRARARAGENRTTTTAWSASNEEEDLRAVFSAAAAGFSLTSLAVTVPGEDEVLRPDPTPTSTEDAGPLEEEAVAQRAQADADIARCNLRLTQFTLDRHAAERNGDARKLALCDALITRMMEEKRRALAQAMSAASVASLYGAAGTRGEREQATQEEWTRYQRVFFGDRSIGSQDEA